jgi:hypothetical protein
MSKDLTPDESYAAMRTMYENKIAEMEKLHALRIELEGQIIQMGSELVWLRELLVSIVQEIRLADLSPDVRHRIEQEIEREHTEYEV